MFRTRRSVLARQARPPQRLDQRGHGVRARLAEPPDGVILLLGGLRQVGDEPLRSGRAGSRTAARPPASSVAQRPGERPGRRVVVEPQERPGAVPVADRDQRRVIRAGSSGTCPGTAPPCVGLAGPDQVVGGLPELDRGLRLAGEQLRAGAGPGPWAEPRRREHRHRDRRPSDRDRGHGHGGRRHGPRPCPRSSIRDVARMGSGPLRGSVSAAFASGSPLPTAD